MNGFEFNDLAAVIEEENPNVNIDAQKITAILEVMGWVKYDGARIVTKQGHRYVKVHSETTVNDDGSTTTDYTPYLTPIGAGVLLDRIGSLVDGGIVFNDDHYGTSRHLTLGE